MAIAHHTSVFLLLLLLATHASLRAQSVDTIRPNPNAVQLRRVWSVTGGEFGGGGVGFGCGNLGDVFGVGRSAFAICAIDTTIWRIYLWDSTMLRPTQRAVITGHSAYPGRPALVGDFYGDGRPLIGFVTGERYADSPQIRTRLFLDFYSVAGDTIYDAPVVRFADSAVRPPVRINPSDWAAADLDGDGADELILYMDGLYRNNVYTKYPEVWIFRGGPDFRLDTPTVILRALEETDQGARRMWVNDCDGDGRMDIITFGRYKGTRYLLYFYFGREGSPWNWAEPDRAVLFGETIYNGQARMLDIDGDRRLDIADAIPPGRVVIYRTNTGKSYRTRSLTIDDADRLFYGGARSTPFGLGYLSDSGRKYEMLELSGDLPKVLLNGGPSGSDNLYDAYDYYERWVYPGPDITGDGWDDLLTANDESYNNAGIVSLWAGGPYIPRDASMGVRWVSDGVKAEAIALWPNPARDVLHVAWRGDLRSPPRRLVVTALDGRRVVEGTVPAGVGEMLWPCANVPSGLYLCALLDGNDHAIATTQIVVQH